MGGCSNPIISKSSCPRKSSFSTSTNKPIYDVNAILRPHKKRRVWMLFYNVSLSMNAWSFYFVTEPLFGALRTLVCPSLNLYKSTKKLPHDQIFGACWGLRAKDFWNYICNYLYYRLLGVICRLRTYKKYYILHYYNTTISFFTCARRESIVYNDYWL